MTITRYDTFAAAMKDARRIAAQGFAAVVTSDSKGWIVKVDYCSTGAEI